MTLRSITPVLAAIALALGVGAATRLLFHAGGSPAAAGGPIIVIDGDTVIDRDGRHVRLIGFDAAETGPRARCAAEAQLGARATARLRALIAGGNAELTRAPCACKPGTEGTMACNYRRACGWLTVDGVDVGGILTAEGLARPYVCGASSCPRREGWCS